MIFFVALLGCTHASLTCGPGTHQSGEECLADPVATDTDTAATVDSVPWVDTGDSTADSSPADSGGGGDSGVPDVVDVYILAGQSNMDGYSVYTGLPPAWREGDDAVPLYWSGWGTFRPDAPASYGGAAYTGPEVAIGQTLAAAGRHVALVKHAVGGTDLYAYWYPGATHDDATAGPGWTTLMTTMAGATTELDAAGTPWRWAGFVWMQGESDALVDYEAAAYQDNLTHLLARVREETATPDLPAYIGLIACQDLCGYLDTVRTAQANVVAADVNATAVETIDLTRNVYDPWHYDGPGGRQLGSRFGEAILGEATEAPVSAALKVQSSSVDYDGDYTVGWAFSLSREATLTDVGGFAISGNVLGTSTEFGIWDAATQELLVREAIPSWDEAPTSYRDGFWYTAIDPVTLPPGNYVVGLTAWLGDADSYSDNATVSAGPGLTVTAGAYHAGEWLTYPETQFATGSAISFLGPSFLYW